MAVTLNVIDIVAIVAYFFLVIGFGIWSSFKNRGSVRGYFLAGRSMTFIPIAASLYASNIGSVHFIGFAGSGAAGGVYIAGYEIYGPVMLIILGWVFLPVYIRAGVFTMPEYIKKRFGGERIGVYLSLLSLILYIFTKISADLYAGALFLNLSLKFDLYLSIGILIVLAAFFTIGGGLSSVMWTDFIQTVVMMIGAVYLMVISFIKVDGIEGMKRLFGHAVASTTLYSNSTCGIPSKDYFNMIKGFDSDFPWTGLLLGQLINGVWYVCNDQVMVQRVLAAKNITHARGGCIGCGYFKLLSLFLMVMPGMIARILFRDEVACADPVECKLICGNEGGCTNIAYPNLVINLMPTGARGVMLAVMMAALMSSLTSIFNSTSTIFTMDIWKRLRKDAKDVELMIVGRVCVVALVIVSILWIPILQASQGSQLFDYIQSVTSFLAPPVCAIYVCAIFFKRVNEPGAFWGLIVGLIVGMTRFIWEQSYSEPPCGKGLPDTRPSIISKVHYLHFSVILFIITMIVTWTISLLTKPIDEKHLRRLTYFTKNDEEEPEPIPAGPNKGFFCCKKPTKPDQQSNGHVNQNYKSDEGENIKTDQNIENVVDVLPKPKFYKRIFFWICGIESSMNKSNTNTNIEQDDKVNLMHTSIEETPFWSKFNKINLVFQLCICGFLWVFFNKFN